MRDQVVSISRSFDIAQADVQLMLQYFHRRGRLVHFADDPLLSRLVVVNAAWFVQVIQRAVDGFERSLVDSAHLLQSLADKELDRQLQVRLRHTSAHAHGRQRHWNIGGIAGRAPKTRESRRRRRRGVRSGEGLCPFPENL